MKLNLKILVPVIILIISAWVGNIYMFLDSSIIKPVLLKSYSAYPLVENNGFRLRYITNSYDKDRVIAVCFPDINSGSVYVNSYGEEPAADRNFKISTIEIKIEAIFFNNGKRLLDSDIMKPIVLEKVQLITNSNKVYSYDLGEIQLYKENRIKNNAINSASSSSSSQGENISTYYSNSDITINKIYNPMPDLIPLVCDVEINGSALPNVMYPLNFKTGDEIKITFRFRPNNQISNEYRFADYFFPIIFEGNDVKGNPCQIYQHIYSQPYSNIGSSDIQRLIEESR